MKNRTCIVYLLTLLSFLISGQNSTFSPYSRYGLGELCTTTFAHNLGMGGANIALKPDSTMPIFINAGNPASYALIRLTALEVGGVYRFSDFRTKSATVQKWGTNFSYGALGFPIKGKGGACLGIMPYSYVGYDTENNTEESGIGNVTYKFSGSGGFNKAFVGYGVMPFNNALNRLKRKHLNVPDSMKRLSSGQYKRRSIGAELLSDLALGFNVNYIFGNVQQTTRVIYPNSLLYNNTYRERVFTMGNFTGNFGLQTAITIDSVNSGGKHRALKEKVKITFGYFMNLNNTLKANYNTVVYNYILNGFGQEIIRDTAMYNIDQPGTIRLPLEQGVGIGFKKAERMNVVADFAICDWQTFKYFETVNDFKKNYRVAIGMNWVPEKYAAGRGSFSRRINYRCGASYQTGFINIRNTVVSDMSVSAGLGLPVGIGRLSSMVNVSATYGQMGTTANNLIKENYWRINFGFTFSDRWFQKFKYD